MKYRRLMLATLALSGCSGDGLARAPSNGFAPTAPTPPVQTPPAYTPTPVDTVSATGTAWLWVMVIDGSGLCVEGAVIEIVDGQGKGFSGKPSANCDAWSYDGGYFFLGLTPGNPLTIHASAPGYQDNEKSFVPSAAGTQQASFITLTKLYGTIPLGQPTLDQTY